MAVIEVISDGIVLHLKKNTSCSCQHVHSIDEDDLVILQSQETEELNPEGKHVGETQLLYLSRKVFYQNYALGNKRTKKLMKKIDELNIFGTQVCFMVE